MSERDIRNKICDLEDEYNREFGVLAGLIKTVLNVDPHEDKDDVFDETFMLGLDTQLDRLKELKERFFTAVDEVAKINKFSETPPIHP
jgi:hypothetical protein